MKRDERGIALVITLFLMASLSALAVSMMFLAQTETASSRNYRTMSQARYAGEAGIHRAINYLYNPNNDASHYNPPTISFADYGMTQSPVTCLSAVNCSHVNLTGACNASTVATAVSTGCIVLIANFGGLSSNYPDATIRNAFSGAAQGTLAVNGSGSTTNGALGTVGYGTAAILMSMRPVTVYGGFSRVLQTWRIVSDGTAGPSSLLATVEVQATFERTLVPAETFAVFATNQGCNAIQYTGNGGTGSYDSTSLTLGGNSLPVTQTYGGSIGTNGNLNLGGTVSVDGSLYTPRSGVGACSPGSVSAETLSSTQATVTGGMIPLSEAKSYPSPSIPTNTVTQDLGLSSSMTALQCQALLGAAALQSGTTAWSCTKSGSGGSAVFHLSPPTPDAPLYLHDLNLGSNVNLSIEGTGNEVINANSFEAQGNTSLSITNTTTTVNLTGNGVNPVMDFAGNYSTTAFDPSKFQIMYAGTGTIKLRGSNQLAATVYAPNSTVDMASGYDVYGSILAGTYNNTGGAQVYYDRSLSMKYFTISDPFMSSFTWKKY
jgi:Tfp pilus assembly protein PilX